MMTGLLLSIRAAKGTVAAEKDACPQERMPFVVALLQFTVLEMDVLVRTASSPHTQLIPVRHY